MLALLGPDSPLPDPARALRDPDGLLAASLDLTPRRLLEAYQRGIFPWYTDGQPVLWWSPDPRMVLPLDRLHLPRSLRKTIRLRHRDQRWRLSIDACFERVMLECAATRANGGGTAANGGFADADRQSGQDGYGGQTTWITADIRRAYASLHHLGAAHSVEVWNGQLLAGGLYGVSIGRMFYGESMFTRETDASKVALVALARVLQGHGFQMIDCQQKTRHLAALGAHEIPRRTFLARIDELIREPAPDWRSMQIGLPHA